jgi:hypothetical protein
VVGDSYIYINGCALITVIENITVFEIILHMLPLRITNDVLVKSSDLQLVALF